MNFDELREIFSDFNDLEQELFLLFRNKIKEGISVKLNLKNIHFSSYETLRLKKILDPISVVLSNEENRIFHKNRVNTIRGNLDKMVFFPEDVLEGSVSSGGVDLVVFKGSLLSLFNTNAPLKNKQIFFNNIPNHGVVLTLKLNKGDSKSNLMLKDLETDYYLNDLLSKFKLAIQSSFKVPRSIMESRYSLFFNEKKDSQILKSDFDKITLLNLKELSLDVLLLSKILKNFWSVVSNTSLIKENNPDIEYRKKINNNLNSLKNNNCVFEDLVSINLGKL